MRSAWVTKVPIVTATHVAHSLRCPETGISEQHNMSALTNSTHADLLGSKGSHPDTVLFPRGFETAGQGKSRLKRSQNLRSGEIHRGDVGCAARTIDQPKNESYGGVQLPWKKRVNVQEDSKMRWFYLRSDTQNFWWNDLDDDDLR